MTLPSEAIPPPSSAPASAAPRRRPRWHRVYFLLAAFDVLTVCLALFLSHQLMGIYTRSVAVNAEWVVRGDAYAKLSSLAAAVNAPGNDIFDSQDIPLETRRLRRASRAFDAHLAQVRGELRAHVPEPTRAQLAKALADVETAMGNMTAEAGTIFGLFRQQQPTAAGAHMASMDRTYHRLNERIEALRLEVKQVQRDLFNRQLAAARRLRGLELLLSSLVLLMIAAAVFYGRRIARLTERQFHERERDIAGLLQAQQALAVVHAELEDRVQQRTADLQASEQWARAIVVHAHDAFIGMDAAGGITEWNPQAEALFGWSAEEALGQPLQALVIPPRLRAAHQQGLARFLANGEGPMLGRLLQLPGLHRDGHEFPAELTISAIPVGDSHVFSAFLRDISERSRMEQALRVSEDRFQLVSRATNDVVWDWDLVTDGLWFNEAFERTFGYAADSYKPTLDFWVEKIHPDDHDPVMASIEAFIAGDAGRWSGEYRFRQADGNYAHVLDRALIQRDAQGTGTRMVGSMLDVTAQKQQQAELQEAKLAAERASLAKSDFLANMSHEIRTPMNGVLGTLGLLLDSSLSGTQRELAGLARASGETLLSLINDILDFSKIEAGKLSLEPIPFDLLRASEGVADMMAALAAGKDLDLILRYAPDVPRHVIGDPGRIRQVLTNLLSNAIKFTDKGQVLVDVEAEAVDEEAVSLRIRVEDTGLGITESELAHVFDKFTQADGSTTRRHGGTGLGLAISSQLVELMGGTIGADSVPGQGSTFWFTLRLPLQENAPPPLLPPADLAGVRVLIVDDNEVNRRVLHEQVIGWKMRNGSCASADEALVALRAAHTAGDPYGIAILDYQMPGTDGAMLGRTIKEDPDLRDVSLIMLTSMGQRGDVARLKAIGFAAYLVKPARQSELLDALATVWSARIHQHDPGMVTRHTLLEERALRDDDTPNRSFNARVLLAEDHPTNQIVASMMLRNLGCTVDLAGNGREVLEMLQRSGYDVVFMDCEMPVMDGFEATAAIRLRADAKSRIPIIAVTAQAMQGDRERCLAAGMDDYISKPVQTAAFAAALQRWAPTRATPVVAAADTGGDSTSPVAAALDAEVIARLRSLALATDPSLLEQIFAAFQRDGAARIVSLQEAAHRGDALALQQAAHALKGASGNIGALDLADLAGGLEAVGQTGELNDVASQIELVQAEFVRVASEIAAMEADAASHAGRPA